MREEVLDTHKIMPKNPQAAFKIGSALLDCGRVEEALEYFDCAAGMDRKGYKECGDRHMQTAEKVERSLRRK